METIAVVGLGRMGIRIARRLMDAGHDVVVWNRTQSKGAELEAAGARRASTPAEATRLADVTMIMVADPAALVDVSEGSDGIAAGANGKAIMQMGTVGVPAVKRLAAALPADAGLLDAPVLGSTSEVEAGTLKIFAGGPEPLLRTWTPVLERLGEVLHTGDVGSGSAAKLVANMTLFTVLGILGETLALARRSGVDEDVAFEVLSSTPLGAQAQRRRTAISAREYPLRFSLSLARKDADLILEAGEASEADLRMVRAARAWLVDAEAAGLGHADYSAVLGHIIGASS